jgi:hypothetical protein
MQSDMAREKTFNMRLTEHEWARFEQLAAHYELPISSALRMLVREKLEAIAATQGHQRRVIQNAETKAKEREQTATKRRRK